MACRTYRDLRRGLFADPMTDGAISNLVFRDMGTIPQQQSEHVFEMRSLDDAGINASNDRMRGVQNCSDRDIDP